MRKSEKEYKGLQPRREYYRGCIYQEIQTSHGNSGTFGMRAVRGVGLVPVHKWVGEITICGHRYRFRSTNYRNVRWWLDRMNGNVDAISVRMTEELRKKARKDIYFSKYKTI